MALSESQNYLKDGANNLEAASETVFVIEQEYTRSMGSIRVMEELVAPDALSCITKIEGKLADIFLALGELSATAYDGKAEAAKVADISSSLQTRLAATEQLLQNGRHNIAEALGEEETNRIMRPSEQQYTALKDDNNLPDVAQGYSKAFGGLIGKSQDARKLLLGFQLFMGEIKRSIHVSEGTPAPVTAVKGQIDQAGTLEDTLITTVNTVRARAQLGR